MSDESRLNAGMARCGLCHRSECMGGCEREAVIVEMRAARDAAIARAEDVEARLTRHLLGASSREGGGGVTEDLAVTDCPVCGAMALRVDNAAFAAGAAESARWRERAESAEARLAALPTLHCRCGDSFTSDAVCVNCALVDRRSDATDAEARLAALCEACGEVSDFDDDTYELRDAWHAGRVPR